MLKQVTDLSSSSHHADPDCAGGTRGVLQTGTTLTSVSIFGVLLGKDVHCVGSHLFLSNKHLKTAKWITLISKITNLNLPLQISQQHIQEKIF